MYQPQSKFISVARKEKLIYNTIVYIQFSPPYHDSVYINTSSRSNNHTAYREQFNESQSQNYSSCNIIPFFVPIYTSLAHLYTVTLSRRRRLYNLVREGEFAGAPVARPAFNLSQLIYNGPLLGLGSRLARLQRVFKDHMCIITAAPASRSPSNKLCLGATI